MLVGAAVAAAITVAVIVNQQSDAGGGVYYDPYAEYGGADPGYNTETEGGYIFGNGSESGYYDPESGCSVISGDGVSC